MLLEALFFLDLSSFIRAVEVAGFSSVCYWFYFYSLCALFVLFVVMVFMVVSFLLRPVREGGLVKVILLFIAAGFAVYFFESLIKMLGRSGAVPVLLVVIAFVIVFILFGMTLVFMWEDG